MSSWLAAAETETPDFMAFRISARLFEENRWNIRSEAGSKSITTTPSYGLLWKRASTNLAIGDQTKKSTSLADLASSSRPAIKRAIATRRSAGREKAIWGRTDKPDWIRSPS